MAPEPMEIDYIALFVADVERSLGFYRDVLGFDFSKPGANDGVEGRSGSLRIGLYSRQWLPRLFGSQGQQQQGDAKNYPILLSMTVDDLDATYQHLLQAGVNVIAAPRVMTWGQRLCFLEDPDGNLLEMVQRSSS